MVYVAPRLNMVSSFPGLRRFSRYLLPEAWEPMGRAECWVME